ncbi:hypothetical protein HK096_002800 [Nowakowskiella sp. JEL0078]|nr:hypothetical protein HK096_002800 [Nowakowskiella sp. JEL0078]
MIRSLSNCFKSHFSHNSTSLPFPNRSAHTSFSCISTHSSAAVLALKSLYSSTSARLPVNKSSVRLTATLGEQHVVAELKSAVSKPTGFKALMKEYGPVAFITYSCISCVSYLSWVSAIHLGLDVSIALEYFTAIKSSVFGAEPAVAIEADPKEISQYAQFGTTLLMALAAHKIILPLRLALTGTLTPWMAKTMRRLGLEFWKKG